MKRNIWKTACALSLCACLGLATSAAQAATIIKLNLGGVGPDIELAGGVFSTVDDLDASTTGDQNTAILFDDFLNGNPDINTSTASFTLDGLAISGAATVGPGFVSQAFTGGSINLYGPAPTNTLLLQGQLVGSSIFATTGPGGGVFFTTTLGNVIGGTLDSAIADNTLSVQMTLSNVNGGAGVTAGAVMNPFVADSSVTLEADAVPEPTAGLLALVGCVLGAVASRRSR